MRKKLLVSFYILMFIFVIFGQEIPNSIKDKITEYQKKVFLIDSSLIYLEAGLCIGDAMNTIKNSYDENNLLKFYDKKVINLLKENRRCITFNNPLSDLKLYFELGATRNYYELSFYHLYLESEKYTSKLSVINWLNGEVVYSRVIKISDFENTNKTSISLKALDEASKILDVIDTDCNIIKRFVSKIKQRF